MCYSVLKEVKRIWDNVNPEICIIERKTACDKLVKEWENAKSCAKKKGMAGRDSQQFIQKLDRLFDMAKCKCRIYECAEQSCPGCRYNAHVVCKCPRDHKIPLIELQFMLSQRNKVGERGTMQISNVDKHEAVRYATKLKRRQSREKTEQANKNIDENPHNIHQDYFDQDEIIEDPDDQNDLDVIYATSSTENVLDVTRVGAAAVRYNVSTRATAAICTATLAAAKDAGLLKEDADILIDRNKIIRAKSRVMRQTGRGDELTLREANIQCIFFDGRIDKTKIMNEENGKFYPAERKEDHYSLCSEPGGKYLTHLTVDTDERMGRKPADHLATLIYDWIVEYGISKSLIAVGADSTNLNTGHKGGVIHFLENKLERRLIWLICALHTNELPLRHLMLTLDGKTTSNVAFSGPVGKIVHNVTNFRVKDRIPKLNVKIELIELGEEVIKSLSNDQKYLYEITCAIKNGVFPEDLKNRAIGAHHHARWLNLANRLCRAWCSENSLPRDAAQNLKLLVEFIVGVYSPLWFEIKVKHSWIDGPYHILKQLQLVKLQPKKVQDIVLPYLDSSAWNAHSENLLQTLLCSSDSGDRRFAVDTICKLRGSSEFGDISVRERINPKLNRYATKLVDLIDWSYDIHEPLLTCSMSKNDLSKLKVAPMVVDDFPVHGQAIERCVKEVTRASATVFGQESRDGFIKATLAHRNILPVNTSKKDLIKMAQ